MPSCPAVTVPLAAFQRTRWVPKGPLIGIEVRKPFHQLSKANCVPYTPRITIPNEEIGVYIGDYQPTTVGRPLPYCHSSGKAPHLLEFELVSQPLNSKFFNAESQQISGSRCVAVPGTSLGTTLHALASW